MVNLTSIRDSVDSFRHFLEDRTGRLHRQLAYPPKLIYYFLNMFTAAVNLEYKRKKGVEDNNLVLTIPCVSLIDVDIVECPCAPKKGCSFYKSIHPLPRLVDGKPISVTSADGFVSYDYLEWFDFKDKLNSRLYPDTVRPYYTLKIINNQQHIYLYSSDKVSNPKAASISGIFEDPIEVAYFPTCDDTPRPFCNPLDEPFMINKELEPRVFELTFNALSKFKGVSTGSDILNNSNNDQAAQTSN